MIRTINILFFVFIIQNASSQYTLSIRQIGINTDTIPNIIISDVKDQKPLRINDSTIQFSVPPSENECLFINFDRRWFTRVWIDPTVIHKELIVNYSKKTATIKDGYEIDIVLEKVLSYSSKGDRHKADSIAIPYVEKNRDQYFSLWLLSHGLNREYPNRNSVLLDSLSPRLKQYPVFRQMKASLNKRKYPNYGDNFKEFTLNDNKEIPFNSTSINNKIIILHFWSTSCGPCVKGMDELVKFYKSLDTSKNTFISVSLDEDKSKWKKSATTNKIIWANLWTEDNSYCDLCLNYNLTAMPYFVMFNKEKKITFYNDGEDIELLKSKLKEIDK